MSIKSIPLKYAIMPAESNLIYLSFDAPVGQGEAEGMDGQWSSAFAD